MSTGKVQAKDIPDEPILAVIRAATSSLGAHRWEIGEALGDQYPEKVVLAKLRSMCRRGVIVGCCCGCRGDFTLKSGPDVVVPSC